MTRDKMLLSYAVGIIAIFVVFCDGAQLQGAARGQYNHTRKGICILEVPTIDLLSPEDRHGGNLRGNSSREGYSKIEVCCSGYARKPHSHYECHPVCDGCEHGNCTAPGVCECKRGYILLRDTTQKHNVINDCVPTCPFGCLNGICTNTGVCSCNAGTVPSKDGKYCLPHCTGGCGQGGHCTGPEHCTCDDGLVIDEKTNKCGYYCEGGCGEGSCIGPNTCSCKPGYKLQGNKCTPDCPKGCLNGECIAPNKCSCKPGWTLDITGSKCTPHCSNTCLNGDCVAPDTCACKNGYVPAPGVTNNEKCVAHCPGGCPNGVCSAPNFCICNPGFIKEAKGSNVCLRRVRRSIHYELIPEQLDDLEE